MQVEANSSELAEHRLVNKLGLYQIMTDKSENFQSTSISLPLFVTVNNVYL